MEAYLDYNSTTPLDPQVFEVMKPFLSEAFGNASSIHKKGQRSRHAVEAAREQIADFLEVEPGDLVFTSGGTEADNLAVKGIMEWLGDKRKHLVVSKIEHQAVLSPAEVLAKRGYRVSFVPVDKQGLVELDYLNDAVDVDTALVSIMHVNNEIGTIQPVEEIARMAHAKGAYFHADAVQSFGKLPIHPEESGIDLMSMSAHKICGPKGVGALYIRKGLKIKAMTHGGHQEKNIRPGTENVAAIAGFGKAVELAAKALGTIPVVQGTVPWTIPSMESERVRGFRDRLYEGIHSSVPDVRLNGDPQRRLYNTLNLSFPGLEGEMLLMNLDFKNIYVSTGSACTAGSVEPSHVLLALGLPDELARAAVRFSLGRFTTEKEIDYALNEIPLIVERLRKNSTSIGKGVVSTPQGRGNPAPTHPKLP